ncbi:MAG: FAD-dependent oxidoreductase, partial [Firmicutes bacterium]|nr:FAD-dependent oxidoreductase [Bacillota bacterium]
MGNPRAFLTIDRKEAGYRSVHERLEDFSEVEQTLNSSDRRKQASRCMECGVPFCHWACPLGNKQPEWQDLVYKGRWKEAYLVLEETCDFPEFTGRICPALCEKSCVLKLSADAPVAIRENEAAIIEAAFREEYIQPVTPVRNGRKVAVIGSGPAGLAAANQLNRKGYTVTVFEKDELPGGLLRFGIPNFKLSKNVIDRRIRLMKEEGIEFRMNTMI